MSRYKADRSNDRDDTHDRYTTSLNQQSRPELVSAYYRSHLHDYSRPSSSSGSHRTLRRTPNFDEPRPARLRSTSLDEPPSARLRSASVDHPRRTDSVSPEPQRQQSPQPSKHRRATSAFYRSQPPHPALRISKRTHAAILYAVEEAIRHPNPFTPDPIEENAQMASLGGGGASNGGSRAPGPVPVSSGAPLRTPRDIMRDRTARDAKRQEEQKAEEQRRLADERRRSAERRAATVPGAAPRFSASSSQYTPDVSAQQGEFEASDRRAGRNSGGVAGSDVLGDPVGRAQEYPPTRTRGASVDQTRPAQATTGGARRTQQSQGLPRQPPSHSAAPSAASSSQTQPQPQTGAVASSFPHAFERWETLSSHWEGLTSYWLHKLEQNTEEIRNTVPSASTLNRQITDLSAAGANLFHAVVELQRLRASSERKFQRWFFETRADTERTQENQAKLDNQLRLERNQREESAQKRVEAEEAAMAARREVSEIRRELMISKEEARRAWEELGRRNQESLETAQSLKDGRMTVISGVQVVPYFGGPSQPGSTSQRPTTRDGQQYYAGGAPTSNAGRQSPVDEHAYYREKASPTNTDPFTETARQQQSSLHHEPGQPSLAVGGFNPYPAGTSSTASHQQQRPISTGGHRSQADSTGSSGVGRASAVVPAASSPSQDPSRFYQHAPADTNLYSPRSSSHAPVPATSQATPTQRPGIRSEGSYVDSISEGTEFAVDPSGQVHAHDDGQPVVSQRRVQSDESDELDDDAGRRKHEPARPYRASPSQLLPEAPSVPATSAQAMATFTPTSGDPEGGPTGPDYEGQGYGEWDTLVTRHHHPTRLSDVLEEEEERSSRRTAE